jgi:hypothetical protein
MWSGGSGSRFPRVFADTPCAARCYFSDLVMNDRYDNFPTNQGFMVTFWTFWLFLLFHALQICLKTLYWIYREESGGSIIIGR